MDRKAVKKHTIYYLILLLENPQGCGIVLYLRELLVLEQYMVELLQKVERNLAQERQTFTYSTTAQR